MKKLNKIFAKSEERFVKTVTLFINADDEDDVYIYVDPDYTEAVTSDVLMNLYKKGLIMLDFGGRSGRNFQFGGAYNFYIDSEGWAYLSDTLDRRFYSAEYVPTPSPN